MSEPLWTSRRDPGRHRRTCWRAPPSPPPASRSTPAALEPGDLFVALAGANETDTTSSTRPWRKGAVRCPWSSKLSRVRPALSASATRLIGSGGPGNRGGAGSGSRTRCRGGGDRLGRQDQHHPGWWRPPLPWPGRSHASIKSYNNHIGVPLTLARMPRATRRRGVRGRHEPRRTRSTPLSRLIAPHAVVDHPPSAPVHIENFEDGEDRRGQGQGRDLRRSDAPAGRGDPQRRQRHGSNCCATTPFAVGARVLSFGSGRGLPTRELTGLRPPPADGARVRGPARTADPGSISRCVRAASTGG